MEMTKQPYSSVMMMPVDRFQNFFKWKNKFDEEVSKAKEQAIKDIK